MGASSVVEQAAVCIQLTGLALTSAQFQRLGLRRGELGGPLEAQFSLDLNRPTEDSLNVGLTVEVLQAEVLQMSVTYAATFQQTGALPQNGNPREVWARFAAHTAPLVLYPYIRETMTLLTTKAGLPPFVPPILNFARVFDPATIELPEPEQPDLAAAEL